MSVVSCGRSGLFVEVVADSLVHSTDSDVVVVVVAGWVGVGRAVDRAVDWGEGGSVVALVLSGTGAVISSVVDVASVVAVVSVPDVCDAGGMVVPVAVCCCVAEVGCLLCG